VGDCKCRQLFSEIWLSSKWEASVEASLKMGRSARICRWWEGPSGVGGIAEARLGSEMEQGRAWSGMGQSLDWRRGLKGKVQNSTIMSLA
jgi:hypothetical protein